MKLGYSGSFRVRVGVKTSLVTDTENETVLTALKPRRLRYRQVYHSQEATVPSRLDSTIAGEATVSIFVYPDI